MSLKVKIIGLFLLVALIPYAVIALFVYIDVEQAAEKTASDTITAFATIQKSRAEETLAKYNLQLEQFLTRAQLRRELNNYEVTGNPDSLTTITTIITAAQQGTSNINAIYVLTPKGGVLASTEKESIGQDYSQEEFFQKGSVRNDVTALVKVRGVVYVYLTGPVMYDGKEVGVIAMRAKTDDLFNLFKDYTGLGTTASWGLAKKLPNGDALIIAPGRFDTNPDSSLKNTLVDTPQNANTPLMHALAGEEKTFPDLVDYLGNHVIAATRYISDAGWGIGVTERRSEILAASNRLALQLILFSGLLIIFIGLLSIVVSQIIVRPIRQLSLATKRAASGDLSRQIKIRSNDEIGALARLFNEMAAKLKESYATLEQKVRDRTRDLSNRTAELEDSKAKDEAMLAGIGEGLVVADPRGKVILMSKAAERMLGWTFAELKDAEFTERVRMENEYGQSVPENERPILKALTHAKQTFLTSLEKPYYYIRKDSTKFPIGITVMPVLLEGKLIGAVEVFRDMTEEFMIERTKSDFVTLASHQLRTPLSSIKWFTEMIAAGDAGPLTESQRDYLNEIDESNRRMEELITALLNASRLELDTVAVEPKPLDILQFSHQVLGTEVGKLRGSKTLKVREQYDLSNPVLPCDETLLRIVLENLFSNACKYTPDQGSITVSIARTEKTEAHAAGVLIHVADTGYGIPEDQKSKIFTKLFRADNIKDKDTNGTGLGLYIARLVMRHVGGDLWFESAEGRGSTFYALLPPEGMKPAVGRKKLAL